MLLLRLCGRFSGVHHWEGAPTKYWKLAIPHPHMFAFEALIKVTGDRQVEFLDVSKECQTALSCFLEDHASSSCETLACELDAILGQMRLEVVRTMVTEDGECGSIYIRTGETQHDCTT